MIIKFLIGLEIVVGIVARIYYYKYQNSFLKYFAIFIWYAIINEFIGMFYSHYIERNNTILYNIYRIIEFSFYLLLYKNSIKNVNYKRIIMASLFIYYISVVVNCFFEDFVYTYFVKTYIVGALFMVLAIALYFTEILKSDKIIHINKSLLFWFSVALLINYLPNIPFKVITKYYVNSPTIPYIYLASYSITFITFILIIYGFICSNKIPKH